jgi:3-hydroxymyristoyl/3-hydroxydecanoyl-(acyl carrier protein) dehydratase
MLVAGRFTIPDDHAALPGHFPGNPVVPGVVLIDHAASLVRLCLADHDGAGAGEAAFFATELRQVKFLAPVRAQQEIEVRYLPVGGGQANFACLRGGSPVVTGVFIMSATAPAAVKE